MILPEKAEDTFIQRYFAPLATSPGAYGLHDDAASIIVPAGQDLVISTDTVASGVHFFAQDPAEQIAQKSLRVNLSDLASKGATPVGYFLNLTLPDKLLLSKEWMSGFVRGLLQDQQEFGVSVMGGDTVRCAEASIITICAYGTVPTGKMLRRNGANVGDQLYVSGTIGDAALGLYIREAKLKGAVRGEIGHLLNGLGDDLKYALEQRYLRPQPRTSLAPALLAHASAAMDISDGLLGDAQTLARVSSAALEIKAEKVPSMLGADQWHDESLLQKICLTGGDDYEILCSVPEKSCAIFEEESRAAGIDVSRIGKVVAGEGVQIIGANGKVLQFDQNSYDHFS